MSLRKLESIDTELAFLEDRLKGEEGIKLTEIRGDLRDLIESQSTKGVDVDFRGIIKNVFKDTDNYFLLKSDVISQIEDCMKLAIQSTNIEQPLEWSLYKQVVNLREDKKKLEFMIENGLGWEDMQNDTTMPQEL